MPLPPQKFREIVFLILFSRSFGSCEPEGIIPMIMKELKVAKSAVVRAHEEVEKVEAFLPQIDAAIASFSTEYRFERISCVEKTLLRLGFYEMYFGGEIPPLVALAEAIRLTRKFGTPESAHFVHAMMDQAHKNPWFKNESQPTDRSVTL